MSDYEKLDPRSKVMPSEEYLAQHQHPKDPPLNLLILQQDLEEAIQLIDRRRVEIDAKDHIIANQAVKIEELKSLIIRAADTLEDEFGGPAFGDRDLSRKSPWNLVIELRKAAQ
jgi:hypothetical protein